MLTSVRAGEDGVGQALPAFITNPSRSRRARGFRVERILALLGERAKPEIDAWLGSLRRLVRASANARALAARLSASLASYIEKPESLTDADHIKSDLSVFAEAHEDVLARMAEYDPAEKLISAALKAVIDAQSETTGWQELIELAADPKSLRTALVDRAAREQAAKELAQALRQIDKGNEAVLDDKFGDLSDDIQKWWDLLRPEEHSFFSAVKPRPGARRTIDFKAGLSTTSDRAEPKLRDVVAVFSQSQLHCLGLALFLARSVKEKVGFIVLDDPIISSDEDYRAFFNAMVVEELMKADMQVIVLTQDQRTWKDLGERYRRGENQRDHCKSACIDGDNCHSCKPFIRLGSGAHDGGSRATFDVDRNFFFGSQFAGIRMFGSARGALWQRTIKRRTRRNVAQASGSRLPGVFCSTLMNTSFGSKP